MPGNGTKPNHEPKRPTGIKALMLLYGLISLFYLLKLSQVLSQWFWLENLPVTISPYYLAADSLVWLGAGLSLVRGIWKGRTWSRPAAMVLSILYGLVFWIDRIWIAEPEGLELRWPVNLFLTIIGISMTFIVLNRKSSQEYFRKNPAKIP